MGTLHKGPLQGRIGLGGMPDKRGRRRGNAHADPANIMCDARPALDYVYIPRDWYRPINEREGFA